MTNAALGLSYDHLNGDRGVTQKIKNAMQETAKQFVYIGFLLWEVKQYEYFYENGYSNVYEYAEAELGFKRSSTKNFIAICENFCRKNEHYKELPTMFLDDRWSDYQYSQLTEMLSMSVKQREETKPSMTVKQLRQIKKQPEEPEQITMEELEEKATGQTSGQTNETDDDENPFVIKLDYNEWKFLKYLCREEMEICDEEEPEYLIAEQILEKARQYDPA